MDARPGRPLGNSKPRARFQRLQYAIQRCAEGSDYAGLRARHVTLPGLRALDAWAHGRYNDAADLVAGLLPILGDAGGSRVQLEVFVSLEIEAGRRQCSRRCDPPRPSSAIENAIPFIDVKHPQGNFIGPRKAIAMRKAA